MKTSGIYAIKCARSGRMYIGSAVNIGKRWRTHLWALQKGIHHSKFLQRSWNKYGTANFEFLVLKNMGSVTEAELRAEEQIFLDEHRPEFNSALRATGGPGTGWSHSEETKTKISKAHMGKKGHSKVMSEEEKQQHREFMLAHPEMYPSFKGRKHSAESKAKNSASKKGVVTRTPDSYTCSPETRKKFSDAAKGKPMHPNTAAKINSPEARAKMAATQKERWETGAYSGRVKKQKEASEARKAALPPKQGRGFHGKHSEETKELIRQKKLGRKASEETKKKMSASSPRRKMTEEHKERLKEISRTRVRKPRSEESIARQKESMRLAHERRRAAGISWVTEEQRIANGIRMKAAWDAGYFNNRKDQSEAQLKAQRLRRVREKAS